MHPLGVVPEIQADCLQSFRILLSFHCFVLLLISDWPIFQAICDRRQAVFEEVLAAYSAGQKSIATLKKNSDTQAAKIQELTGMFLLFLFCLFRLCLHPYLIANFQLLPLTPVGVRGRKHKFFITYETHTQDLCYGDASNGQK